MTQAGAIETLEGLEEVIDERTSFLIRQALLCVQRSDISNLAHSLHYHRLPIYDAKDLSESFYRMIAFCK